MSLLALFGINIAVMVLYMSLWFSRSYRLKRLDVVDTAWGGGFIVVALTSLLLSRHVYSGLLALLVSIWGIRLALHISRRNHGKQNDPRYDTLSASWAKQTYWLHAYVTIFLLQGALVLLISTPIILAALITRGNLATSAIIGSLVWLVGLLIEGVADFQLGHFLRTRTAEQKVMNTGLWRWSRHPNYFGEIVVWWGVGLIASSAPYGWLAWLGPVVLTYLIVFVSGLPPQEKRKKNNPAYQEYARHTSILVPLPPRT